MKLHFDSHQDFQLQAIQSVVDIFEGQPLNTGDYEFSLQQADSSLAFSENGVGNAIRLTDQEILRNVQAVQKRNAIDVCSDLQGRNFSVEMETGTGKTYVYLRTIYELNKTYGFKIQVLVINIDSFAKDENIINKPNDRLTGNYR